MAGERVTIKRLREHKQALEAFQDAYAKYLGSYEDEHLHTQMRARVNDRIPAADDALRDLGLGVAVAPPALSGGGPTRYGLNNTAFLSEQPGFRTMPGAPSIDQHVLDIIGQALATIREREKAIKRLHHRPLYWGDRILRALLGFPAYLVGIILGVPKHTIEASPIAGPLLRFVAVVADVVTIYLAGRVLKAW